MTALNMAAKEKNGGMLYVTAHNEKKKEKKDAKRHPLAPIQAANLRWLGRVCHCDCVVLYFR
jgi:hypothetical protein